MSPYHPQFITFDSCGTLIDVRMADAARDRLGHRLGAPGMARFIRDFAAYRLDEILGDWKPSHQVIHNALDRACRRNGLAFRPEDARAIHERIPSWGPHPDVPAALARVAEAFPLVILSNAAARRDQGHLRPARRIGAETRPDLMPRRPLCGRLEAWATGTERIAHPSGRVRWALLRVRSRPEGSLRLAGGSMMIARRRGIR